MKKYPCFFRLMLFYEFINSFNTFLNTNFVKEKSSTTLKASIREENKDDKIHKSEALKSEGRTNNNSCRV